MFPTFENLKITTVTMVAKLSSNIRVNVAFLLLPVTVSNKIINCSASKCKLPYLGKGCIISMAFKDAKRGIIKNKKSAFKNMITLDMGTSLKNNNIKLSPESIQLCGAASIEDGKETVDLILDHLSKVQSYLDLLQEDGELSTELFNWIKEIIKGESSAREIISRRELSNVTLVRKFIEQDYLVNIIDDNVEIPVQFNKDLTNWLLSFTREILYYSDFCRMLKMITNIDSIIDDELYALDYTPVMVNYNFKLGFKVDLIKLDTYIDGINNFTSHFDPAFSTGVKIKMAHEDMPLNNKGEMPHSTILVYYSGSVTLSTKISKAKMVYESFIDAITPMKEEITC